MGTVRYRHVALLVGDGLRSVEMYYARLFDLHVLSREGLDPGGTTWGQLRPEVGWDDAARAGVTIGMVALGRREFVLALFAGVPSGTQLFALGLTLESAEIDAVSARLDDEAVDDRRDDWLAFVDDIGVRWQLSATASFGGAGETRGAWLDIPGSSPPTA